MLLNANNVNNFIARIVQNFGREKKISIKLNYILDVQIVKGNLKLNNLID